MSWDEDRLGSFRSCRKSDCTVTVTAFSGSSKFTINVQDTGTVLGTARRPMLRLISDNETPPELSQLIERLKEAKARANRVSQVR
ncbi:MAG: hypothetical protein IH936_05140 [Acidobacteria bacterium]|nr:hypothetical protein [Acidobacteriota bacterium]